MHINWAAGTQSTVAGKQDSILSAQAACRLLTRLPTADRVQTDSEKALALFV